MAKVFRNMETFGVPSHIVGHQNFICSKKITTFDWVRASVDGCSINIRTMGSLVLAVTAYLRAPFRATNSHWNPLLFGNSWRFSNASSLDPDSMARTDSSGRCFGDSIPVGLTSS